MRPHTAAMIAVLNFLYLESGDIAAVPKSDTRRTFRLVVRMPRTKHYEVRVRSTSSHRIELEVAGFWSCVAQLNRSGRTFTISHQHTPNTYAVERFDLYPGQQVSNSSQTVRQAKFDSYRIAKSLEEFRRSQSVAEFHDTENNVTYDVVWDGIG